MKIPMPRRAQSQVAIGLQPPDPLNMDLRRKAWGLSDRGDYAGAASVWRSILLARSDDGDAAAELGKIFASMGKLDDAVEAFERALEFGADPKPAKLGLGQANLNRLRFPEARVNFEDVLNLEAKNVAALCGLAAALRGSGKNEAALNQAKAAQEIDAASAESAFQCGAALKEMKRPEEAADHLLKALQLQPGHRDAGVVLAGLLRELKRAAEAVPILTQIAERSPDDVGVLMELSLASLDLRRYSEASSYNRRIMAIEPGSVVARSNLAICLSGLGRVEEAIEMCKQALTIEPWSRNAKFALATLYLSIGRFDEGWPLYEFRFLDKDATILKDFPAAPWCGEPLSGKSILVVGEQANGDYFHFIRYLEPLARFTGATVTYVGPKRLEHLLATSSPTAEFLSEIPFGRRFDYQCHLASLPWRFHEKGWPVPSAPYLAAEPHLVERWSKVIGKHGFRAGVVWQGAIYQGQQAERSFPLHQLFPVAQVPDVRLISLQIGKGEEQMESLPPGMVVESLGRDFDNGEDGFVDAAAAMANLDLVIACDTSLAHLAGGLGKEVWIALNESPEWRWGRWGQETMWYGNATLFRQRTRGDWDGVFQEMANTLKARLTENAPSSHSPSEMPMIDTARIPVSWGECIDKATILEIKARHANGRAIKNIETELAALNRVISDLQPFDSQILDLREQLKAVNEMLWVVEDDLRVCERKGKFDAGFVELARSVYRLNDKRAAIKREINTATSSAIIEEKIYPNAITPP